MKNLPTDKIISCFYESSEDCVKVIDTDATLMSFNPNGLKVMEIDDEREVLGKDWLTLLDGDLKVQAIEALEKARLGELARCEGYCPTFKGNMKYWVISIAPLYNEFNEISWLLVTSRDVTRQKELEQLVISQQSEIESLKMKLKLVTA